MDIEHCIRLHNEIAAIHAASPYLHPTSRLQRNFFSAFGDAAISLRPRLGRDLIAFLEGTDYFTTRDTTTTTKTPSPINDNDNDNRVVRNPSFTPHLRFPHPSHLFAYAAFAVADDPVQNCLANDEVILLYHGIADTQWGGLFVDQTWSSLRTHWASLDSSYWPLPRPGAWVALADALGQYVAAWRAGTYALAPEPASPEDPEGCVLVKPFADADLQAALDEWSALLDAVESRVPGHDASPHAPAVMLPDGEDDDELLRDLFLLPRDEDDVDDETPRTSFALQFLRRARAPGDPALSVAPGVGCFSVSRMRELLGADDDMVERRVEACEKNMLDWSERPVLLFPGVVQAEEEVKLDKIRSWSSGGEEQTKMHRETLLADTPGLYVTPAYDGLQDEVAFVVPVPPADGMSNDDGLFIHSTVCPYFAPHRPRLVSVLRCWRRLVESNAFQVGRHGVQGQMQDIVVQAEGRVAAFDLGRCWQS